MGQLTLVEAAIHYHNDEYGNPRWRTSIDLTEVQHANNIQTAFKAGAEWQKEQYKELINLARQLLGAYDIRYPNAKQLLAGYTNEAAFLKFNQLLEQLHDTY